MDSWVILLIITAVAGLSNWLQKRAAESRQEPPPEPGRSPRPRPQPGPHRTALPPRAPGPMPESALERELRRLLGEELPPQPRTPPVQPSSPSPMIHRPALAPPHTVTVLVPATPPPITVIPPAAVVAPAAMSEAQAAYDRAQRLHETVAQRLRGVDDQTEKHGPNRLLHPQQPPVQPALPPIFALGRNPEIARQAFVASLVFGAPKGLEP